MKKVKLNGVVAVVTGASRGIGKGVALELGSLGATVYVTGRGSNVSGHGGSIEQVAAEITEAGGTGIAVICDHASDADVKRLFDQIGATHGHLDILVNNATTIGGDPLNPAPFWEKNLDIADQLIVGLRSAFTASYFSAPLLLKAKRGMIANISYYGAVSYHLDPAYGATKAGLDKLTFDMAADFGPTDVTVVSIWPGPTGTERARDLLSRLPNGDAILASQESPRFSGMAIAHLFADAAPKQWSGQVVIAAEAAQHFGYVDSNGKQPPSLRVAKGAPTKFFVKAAGER